MTETECEEPSGIKKAADKLAKPAEWTIAASVGALLTDISALDAGPEWLPLVGGIIAAILRVLPMFLR